MPSKIGICFQALTFWFKTTAYTDRKDTYRQLLDRNVITQPPKLSSSDSGFRLNLIF